MPTSCSIMRSFEASRKKPKCGPERFFPIGHQKKQTLFVTLGAPRAISIRVSSELNLADEIVLVHLVARNSRDPSELLRIKERSLAAGQTRPRRDLVPRYRMAPFHTFVPNARSWLFPSATWSCSDVFGALGLFGKCSSPHTDTDISHSRAGNDRPELRVGLLAIRSRQTCDAGETDPRECQRFPVDSIPQRSAAP